ncbi:MAG: hypothetical protein RIA69_20295 [Cyclobacteriaceae bacterium]
MKASIMLPKYKSITAGLIIWMTVRWPYSLLSDWKLRSDGYIRMHKERLISILAGIVLWVSFGLYTSWNYERTQRPWQNEVNRQDIYDWEKDNYSHEEIVEFRKESIEQLIETVRTNEADGIPTYVILDRDTITNRDVEQLRHLDMLNIRDVVFQGDFEPELHEWVIIKLVKSADNRR